MTDKQLERGNAIKKELTDLEIRKIDGSMLLIMCGDPMSNSLFPEIEKIQTAVNKRIEKRIDEKISELKKEFAKL